MQEWRKGVEEEKKERGEKRAGREELMQKREGKEQGRRKNKRLK